MIMMITDYVGIREEGGGGFFGWGEGEEGFDRVNERGGIETTTIQEGNGAAPLAVDGIAEPRRRKPAKRMAGGSQH